jgi:hypothetical protein
MRVGNPSFIRINVIQKEAGGREYFLLFFQIRMVQLDDLDNARLYQITKRFRKVGYPLLSGHQPGPYLVLHVTPFIQARSGGR